MQNIFKIMLGILTNQRGQLGQELNKGINDFAEEKFGPNSGRAFNSQSTDFAPQPFAAGGGTLEGIKGQSDIYRGMAPYGTPPAGAPSGARVGVPALPESSPTPWRFANAGGQSNLGEGFGSEWADTAGAMKPPIERTGVPEAGTSSTSGYGEGISEIPGKAPVGPERFFKGGKEVGADVRGAESGDYLARERIGRESRASEEASRGQDILDREAAARAKKEGEFDYAKFKEGISGFGGKLSPRLESQLYQHALTEHGRMQELKEKAREANLIHGEGSASMIGAKSMADYHDVIGKAALLKAPAEREQHLATARKMVMDTLKVPYEIANLKASADLKASQSDLPGVKKYKIDLDSYLKEYTDTVDPVHKQELVEKIKTAHDNMDRETSKHEFVRAYNRKNGTNISADQLKWDDKSQSYVEAK